VNLGKVSVVFIYFDETDCHSRMIWVLVNLALCCTHPFLTTNEHNFSSAILPCEDELPAVQIHSRTMWPFEALKNYLHVYFLISLSSTFYSLTFNEHEQACTPHIYLYITPSHIICPLKLNHEIFGFHFRFQSQPRETSNVILLLIIKPRD
jgi:hypothetical protein